MLWVLIRIHHRGNFFDYPQHMFLWRQKKKSVMCVSMCGDRWRNLLCAYPWVETDEEICYVCIHEWRQKKKSVMCVSMCGNRRRNLLCAYPRVETDEEICYVCIHVWRQTKKSVMCVSMSGDRRRNLLCVYPWVETDEEICYVCIHEWRQKKKSVMCVSMCGDRRRNLLCVYPCVEIDEEICYVCIHEWRQKKKSVMCVSMCGDRRRNLLCVKTVVPKSFMASTRIELELGGANRHQSSVGNVSGLASCQVWEAGSGHCGKSSKYLRKFRVGTLNVNTLRGNVCEVVETPSCRKVDVCCIQETRYRGGNCRTIKGKDTR